jgi:DNA-binding response OmpR family regulator
MDSRPIVLIADDEIAATRLVARSLTEEGFNVITANDGPTAIERVWDLNPDVLLLDSVMPGVSGLDVLRELRDSHPVRIILMSGQDAVARVTEGLDLGADDYVVKPFYPAELAARIRSVLRRRRNLLHGTVAIGDAVADLDRSHLIVDGERVDLSRKEWLLLERLIAAEGGVVTHDELLLSAFGPAYLGDAAYLRLWIGQLRRRLQVPAWDEGPIRTVPGLGYVLDPHGEIPVRRVRRPASTHDGAAARRDAGRPRRAVRSGSGTATEAEPAGPGTQPDGSSPSVSPGALVGAGQGRAAKSPRP